MQLWTLPLFLVAIGNAQSINHDQYPFMVSIRLIADATGMGPFTFHLCSGTIIRSNPLAVLTAAWCIQVAFLGDFFHSSSLLADIGRTHPSHPYNPYDKDEFGNYHKFERFNMTHYIVHENFTFKPPGTENDIAILFFNGSTNKTSLNTATQLSHTAYFEGNESLSSNYNSSERDSLIAIGYRGWCMQSRSDTLKYTDVVLIDDIDCNLELNRLVNASYSSSYLNGSGWRSDNYPWNILPEGHSCAYPLNISCNFTYVNGYIGGPLLSIDDEGGIMQIGVISSRYMYGAYDVDYPMVFTDVGYYYDWINSTLYMNISIIPEKEEKDIAEKEETTDIPTGPTEDGIERIPEDEEKDNNSGIIIGSVIAACFALGLIALCVFIWKYKKDGKQYRNIVVMEEEDTDADTEGIECR